ncbi:uroporphyrinogen-III C-methyltransferase [Sulfolobales archaeon HS-7]|nr:uroporphyrinogen-III C-methyltransferase [Sulfolobales archaeon HS-7]
MGGIVYLVGAGPGDPELITVKGLSTLRKAEVVIYDRLIDKKILSNVRGDALLIYAGKNIGEAEKQETITSLIIKHAKEGKIVVRLKGGDPYVFGRGEEECERVINEGIPCEVIPGVTSAIAGPTYAGIPITGRQYSPAVSIISATRKGDEVIEPDYIPSKGTLVILMGIHKFTQLRGVLLKVRSANEPVAVIENATLESQRVFICSLNDMDKVISQNNVKSPAVIVVGDVVKMRDKLWKLS